MTFDEMKQMMEQMSQKMQKNDKGEMKFKVSANATGKTKQVSGFDAKEMIMKMEMEGTDKESGQKGGMTVTTDMWIASGHPGLPGSARFLQTHGGKDQLDSRREHVRRQPAGIERNGRGLQRSRQTGRSAGAAAHLDGRGRAAWRGGRARGRQRGAGPQPAQQQPSAPPPSIGGALGGALGGRFGLGRKKPRRNSRRLRPMRPRRADRRRVRPDRCWR